MACRPISHVSHEHQFRQALIRVPGSLLSGTITSVKGQLIALTEPREAGEGGLIVAASVVQGGVGF